MAEQSSPIHSDGYSVRSEDPSFTDLAYAPELLAGTLRKSLSSCLGGTA